MLAAEVRSLRHGTRAHALRDARICYDHLAGRLGVSVMTSLIERELIAGGDGRFDPHGAREDRPSAYGHDVDYQLTEPGHAFLTELGVELPAGRSALR